MYARMSVASALMLICAGPALAQSSVDRSFKVTSKDCSGVQWSAAALEAHPNLGAACEAVEERNGKTYVKFQGEVVRNIQRGKQLEVKFKNGADVTLSPPANMTVYINGRKTPARDLQRGDDLTFYVPEDRLVAHVPETDASTTQYVVVPIIYREVDLIEYRDAQQSTAARLPETASQLPLAALFGIGLLGVGLASALCRWRG